MSRPGKVFEEADGAPSEFLSEDGTALSRPEFALDPGFVSEADGLVSEALAPEGGDNSLSESGSFLSERDGNALLPVVVTPAEPLDGARELVVDGVWAQLLPAARRYLLPLALAVVAVTTVERVSMWKGLPPAPSTEGPIPEATEPPSAVTPSPAGAVASPAAAAGAIAAKPVERGDASRVAPPPPAREESAAGSAVEPQPARTARPAAIEVAAISAPAVFGIAAKAPSIEMRTPGLPAPIMPDEAPAAATIALAVLDAEALDKAAIDRVLGTYQQSYSALDAGMVSTIWRGLDTRGLQRAFDGLDSQRMSFDQCEVTVEDNKASAFCTGVLDYVRKVGQTNTLQKRLSWHFDLERTDDDRWLISKVNAR